MKYKHKVLFNILARQDTDIIVKSVESCLNQFGITPFFNIACIEGGDDTFSKTKSLCKNPFIYEPNLVLSENMLISKGNTSEQAITTEGINFGAKNQCKYFCFMHSPCIVEQNFIDRCIGVTRDDIVGCYSNLIDTGIDIYTSLINENLINIGPLLFTKESIVQRFNHPTIGDFIKGIIATGVLYHFPEFLTETQWIKYILKREQGMNKAA